MDKFDQEVADAIEPYLSREYNISIGRIDWAQEGLKSVSVGEGHELYQAVKALKDKAYTAGKAEGAAEGANNIINFMVTVGAIDERQALITRMKFELCQPQETEAQHESQEAGKEGE